MSSFLLYAPSSRTPHISWVQRQGSVTCTYIIQGACPGLDLGTDSQGSGSTSLPFSSPALLCVGFSLGLPFLMVPGWLQQLQPSPHSHIQSRKGALVLM